MMTNTYLNIIRNKILSYKPDFNLEILEIGLEKFQASEFKAGDCILKAGETCENIFLTEKSITRCFFLGEDGEEKTMWIEPEMSFITDYECFSSEIESRCDIVLYEDSAVFYINRVDLLQLYLDYHEWALVGILVIEGHFVNLVKLRTTINFNGAAENYNFIEDYFSRYLEVVPLKHLASWLNISAVHFSRIRKERLRIKLN